MIAQSKRLIRRYRWGVALRSPWFYLILGGYLLRLALMPLTGQHDVMFMAWQAHFIDQGHLNLYAYLARQFGKAQVLNGNMVWAPYPYGFYTLSAAWLWILEHLSLVDLVSWSGIWEVTHPARYVFLMKLIYLPVDLLAGVMIFHLAPLGWGRAGWALWVWSPAALYTPFMMGQNDLLATAFTLAAVWAASTSLRSVQPSTRKRWGIAAALLLGSGSIFKIFPLLVLPAMAWVLARRWRLRFGLAVLGSAPLFLASLPFVRTSTYVQGVLFNPEGLNLFREVNFFGLPVALFPVGYLLLLIGLSLPARSPRPPESAWETALVVLSWVFVCTPAPLYWWLWLTPLLVLLAVSRSGGWLVWAGVSLAFGILLLNQHPELGVNLPLRLEGEFNFPGFTAAQLLTQPSLAGYLPRLWLLANSLFVAALLGGIGLALAPWIRSPVVTFPPAPAFTSLLLAPLPVAVLLAGLAVHAWTARLLVFEPPAASTEEIDLNASAPVLRTTLIPQVEQITGLRLAFSSPSSPGLVLEACLFDASPASPSLNCARTDISRAVDGRYLYFRFDAPLTIRPNQLYPVEIRLLTPGAALRLPYLPSEAPAYLERGDELLPGRLALGQLHPFRLAAALRGSLGTNVFQDPILVILILLVYLSTTAGIAWRLTHS